MGSSSRREGNRTWQRTIERACIHHKVPDTDQPGNCPASVIFLMFINRCFFQHLAYFDSRFCYMHLKHIQIRIYIQVFGCFILHPHSYLDTSGKWKSCKNNVNTCEDLFKNGKEETGETVQQLQTCGDLSENVILVAITHRRWLTTVYNSKGIQHLFGLQ